MALEIKIALDASEYRRELAKVVQDSKNAQKTLEQKNGQSGQSVDNIPAVPEIPDRQVEINVAKNEVPQEAQKAKEALNNIPGRKNVKMDAQAPTSFFEKMKGGFSSIRGELVKTEGGAGEFCESLLAGGGLIGILIAGFASLGKIAANVYDRWINGMKEAGELAQRNAASIRESAEENEKLRQKTDGYMSSLATLSQSEKLSNANKAEARKLIDDLTKSYGDLGLKLDETTGKLSGVDSAMIAKAQKDKERRIKELEAELRQIQADNKAQADLRDKAGIPAWFGGDVRVGGEATIKEASAKIEENNKRAMAIRKLLHEQRKADPEKELRDKRSAEVKDLKKSYADQTKNFERQKDNDAFNAEKDLNKKIALREEHLAKYEKEKVTPLEEKVKNAQNSLQNAKTDIDRLEAQKNLLQLQKELQSEYEKVYAFEKEITSLEEERFAKEEEARKAKKQLLDDAKNQADLNKLLVNGALDAYEAEKLRLDLKKQGISLTKAETDELLKQQKNVRTQDMKKSLLDQAQALAWDNMRKNGQGLEADRQKALLEAEKLKGGSLTKSEADLVARLAELTHSAANQKQPDFGDTSIKTNSLTARGGFQGGAVMPDKDRINMVISTTVKAMQQQQREIRSLVNDIKRALT